MKSRKSQQPSIKAALRGTGVKLSKAELQEVLEMAAAFTAIIKSNAK